MSRTTIPTLKIEAMTLHASFFSSAAWPLLMLFSGAVWAQPNLTPGAVLNLNASLVVGGTAHLGTGEAIENAAIGFADGFIDFVGAARDVDRKRYDRVVEADGHAHLPRLHCTQQHLGPHGGGGGARIPRLPGGGHLQAQRPQCHRLQRGFGHHAHGADQWRADGPDHPARWRHRRLEFCGAVRRVELGGCSGARR